MTPKLTRFQFDEVVRCINWRLGYAEMHKKHEEANRLKHLKKTFVVQFEGVTL